jgi:hypothetical protein
MRPALPNQRQFPVRRRGKKRRLLSMRPEKRPQTIMEQYRYREMMRQPHNKETRWHPIQKAEYDMRRSWGVQSG